MYAGGLITMATCPVHRSVDYIIPSLEWEIDHVYQYILLVEVV